MHDFEVHPLNTHLELRLARNLANTMAQEQQQWGNIYPRQVTLALQALLKHYESQAEFEQTQ